MDNKPVIKESDVARHLNMWIGLYFSNKESIQEFTLGEFLAHMLPRACNVYILQWIVNWKEGTE